MFVFLSLPPLCIKTRSLCGFGIVVLHHKVFSEHSKYYFVVSVMLLPPQSIFRMFKVLCRGMCNVLTHPHLQIFYISTIQLPPILLFSAWVSPFRAHNAIKGYWSGIPATQDVTLAFPLDQINFLEEGPSPLIYFRAPIRWVAPIGDKHLLWVLSFLIIKPTIFFRKRSSFISLLQARGESASWPG